MFKEFKQLVILFIGIWGISCRALVPIQLESGHEGEVLKLVAPFLPHNPYIIDAGAFDGTDSVEMKRFWPGSSVYAFEPVPDIYVHLINRTKNYDNLYCFSLALSAKVGLSKFFVSTSSESEGRQSSSLRAPKEHLKYAPEIRFDQLITIPTITLDTWAQLYHIPKVDFLWFDLQGVELDVLKVAPKTLATVKAIYTKVEFVEAYEGQSLYSDMKQWLDEQGFVEYARNFDLNNQKQWFGNVLFIRKELIAKAKIRAELI